MFRDMYTTVSALIEVAAGVDELRQEYDELLAQKTKAVDVFNRLLEADPSVDIIPQRLT